MNFESPPPLSEERFAELCRTNLSAKDYAAFEVLRNGGKSSHPFAREWNDFEMRFRNAIVKLRAAKLGVEPEKWLRKTNAGKMPALPVVDDAINAAFAESDPMRRETALQKIRWNNAEKFAGADIFSSAAILARFIHLRILIERAKTNKDAGLARLMKITTNK